MKKPVSLTVHRNKVESRRKRELASHAKARVEQIIRETDIRAFAFVAINAEGKMFATWDTGAIMPMWAFPAMIGEALRRDMEDVGVSEDWKPNLTVRG